MTQYAEVTQQVRHQLQRTCIGDVSSQHPSWDLPWKILCLFLPCEALYMSQWGQSSFFWNQENLGPFCSNSYYEPRNQAKELLIQSLQIYPCLRQHVIFQLWSDKGPISKCRKMSLFLCSITFSCLPPWRQGKSSCSIYLPFLFVHLSM